MDKIKENDTVELTNGKDRFFIKIEKGKVYSTHLGNINHDDIIGKKWGDTIQTHSGHNFILIKPSLYDIIMYAIKRQTQIIYPKDSGYITLKLGLRNGMKVLESGIGSGALTIVMANALYPDGRIYAYEKEEKFLNNALKNIQLAGFENIVNAFIFDLANPLPEKDFDAAFIDVREPWLYLDNIKEALKKGAPIGFLLPTTNQVIELLKGLKNHGFINIEVQELFVRDYKPVFDRFRPEDRMVAHTGYLIFAKKGF